MAHRPLRFVHASDLHLERPPTGLIETPEHLRQHFLECPYAAAEQVFEAAIAEQVDAVLLSGDVVDLSLAGPRAIVFLRTQFERLADRHIPVYWAGGEVDPPQAWPACSPLPASVHVLPRGVIEEHDLVRDGRTIARIVGTSGSEGLPVRASQFVRHPDGLFTIGLGYGQLADGSINDQCAEYLALGGRHDRTTISATTHIAHYPGTTQGRGPAESGPRGCTLTSVDAGGQIKTQSVATDTLRWYTESVEISPDTTAETLHSILRARITSLLAKAGGAAVLVTWQLKGRGPLVHRLRTSELATQLLSELRQEYEHQSPTAWSVHLEVTPARPLPKSWYEQETILGDVFRAIRQLEAEPVESLDLLSYLSDEDRRGWLAAVGSVPDGAAREDLLHDTTDLCVDLLTVAEQHEHYSAAARVQSRASARVAPKRAG